MDVYSIRALGHPPFINGYAFSGKIYFGSSIPTEDEIRYSMFRLLPGYQSPCFDGPINLQLDYTMDDLFYGAPLIKFERIK